MNNQLKQRLVGAVVLVALAVIFIPMLLPGKGDLSSGIDGSNIPPEPDFRFPPVPVAPKAPPLADVPAAPLGDADRSKVGKSPATSVKPAPLKKAPVKPVSPPVANAPARKKPVSAPTASTAAPKAKSAQSAQTSAWVVQVGSFAARKNARALRDKLRKQGYSSFMESINGAAGRVYRVRVGPELNKSAANKLRQRLAREAGLKGLVQAYP